MKVDFRHKKVAVLGDLILDEYIEGKVSRISPEAPVPVVELIKEEYKPGGAANVAVLLKTLGADVTVAGVVGNDERGDRLKTLIEEKGVDTFFVIRDSTRPTTVKTRIISRAHHIVRLDREKKISIHEKTERQLIDRLSSVIKSFDAIIIEDYDKGFITEDVVNYLKTTRIPIYVDPKIKNMSLYRDVQVLKPNYKEFITTIGLINNLSLDELYNEILRFRDAYKVDTLIVTLGARGMVLALERKLFHVPAIKREVYDVTGAGDMVIAAYALSELSGFSCEDAAIIASVAAGIEVTKLGATPVDVNEINDVLIGEYEMIKKSVKCIYC